MRSTRTVIAGHQIFTLYGHWAVNDPRGSGSREFHDRKFAPLGPIHHGRRPDAQQPTRTALRTFHHRHAELLNFPLIWIDEPKRRIVACAIAKTIHQRGYTCYACAICSNHAHLLIRTHRDRAPTMWDQFATAIRDRLRDSLPEQVSEHHPVIASRPHNVLLYTPAEVRGRVRYIEANPVKEGSPPQVWDFVVRYDGWPLRGGGGASV